MNKCRRRGFTLVELLIVIGIIALLISILLPSLSKARETAKTIKCGSNLHNVGLAMCIYLAENRNTFPAAYTYNGMIYNPAANIETPTSAVSGYITWSGYLYGYKSSSTNASPFTSNFGWDMYQCPSQDGGGLPPSDTFAANLLPGQVSEFSASGSLPYVKWNGCDLQAPRLAYAINEAICPRNKFVVGFQNAVRTYQYVRANKIRSWCDTILATEWNQDWRVVQPSGTGATICLSHRPVSGFVPLSSISPVDIDQMPITTGTAPGYRRAAYTDLQKNSVVGATVKTTLDWVGRNHGSKGVNSNGYNMKTTNFLYVDGHVASKNILQTLGAKFEWGDYMYSLTTNGDLQR